MPKKQMTDRSDTRFAGPAGETTIPLYSGMLQDLPPIWSIRYQDLVAAFLNGTVGNQEFFARLACVMTHLPGVPGNQRLDPRAIDLGQLTHDQLVSLINAGVAIQPYIAPGDQEGADSEGGDAKNA